MGLGFLVDQIYLVILGNYDPHARKSEVFWFFIYRASKLQVLLKNDIFFNILIKNGKNCSNRSYYYKKETSKCTKNFFIFYRSLISHTH